MKQEQIYFPFSCIVNTTLKNTLQDILCLEIVFMISILLTVAAAKYLLPCAWRFSFPITSCRGGRGITAAGFCWGLKFSGNEMH